NTMGKVKSTNKGYKSPEIEKFSDVVDTAKDQVGAFVPDFFEQLVGFSVTGKSDSPENDQKSPDQPLIVKDPVTGAVEVFNAASNKSSEKKVSAEKAPRKDAREAAINYGTDVAKASERAMHPEMREINHRLNEIMSELQRLISSSKE